MPSPFKRLRRDVRFDVDVPTIADAVAIIKQREHQASDFVRESTSVHVSKHGSLRMAIGVGGRSGPVRFEGQLEPGGRGVVVAGVITEPADSIIVGAGFTGIAALLLIFAVVAGAGGSVVAALIFLVLAILFALPLIFAWKAMPGRQDRFDRTSGKLADGLQWLTAPDYRE